MKGILFKPWKIKLISQMKPDETMVTRRGGDKLKKINQESDKWKLDVLLDNGTACFLPINSSNPVDVVFIKPHYQVGDIVYIKEAWAADWAFDDSMPCDLSASNPIYFKDTKLPYPEYSTIGRWRSPLHLREVHARYLIKILDVRLERLQKISSYDIVREGCPFGVDRVEVAIEVYDSELALMWYKNLWDSINAKRGYSWESNPWVFRYEFKLTNRKG